MGTEERKEMPTSCQETKMAQKAHKLVESEREHLRKLAEYTDVLSKLNATNCSSDNTKQ